MEAMSSATVPTVIDVSLHYTTSRSLDDEMARATSGDRFTFILSYTIMTTFLSFSISRKRSNLVESRIGLSFCGIMCIMLGTFYPTPRNIYLCTTKYYSAHLANLI